MSKTPSPAPAPTPALPLPTHPRVLLRTAFLLACATSVASAPPATAQPVAVAAAAALATPPPPQTYPLPASEYKSRLTSSDPATWNRISDQATAPTKNVTLPDESLFKTALERNTIYLLNSFSLNHILVPFRTRAGHKKIPSDKPQQPFWDTQLRGANAGRFMMGAGNTLRWLKNAKLQQRLDSLIDEIEACRRPDGYILAYPPEIKQIRSEEPNYARAWFTHGLIDAAISGNPKAYGLLRGHADWFNHWDEMLPKLLHWDYNSHQGHIASTRTYLSKIGKPEDLQVAEKYYVCDWWIDGLAARNTEAVWHYPLQNPHSYLITSFEAYLDHYRATGDRKFLEASDGAWELIHDKWEHVGGSIAICESQWYPSKPGKRVLKPENKNGHPPSSYYITRGHTGETCGNVFWLKFNQRFHQLYPTEEKYVTEIEKSIYNVILANQTKAGNIRYHAVMEGKKEFPRFAENTCCEAQGTRALGSLPEYIYSLAADGVYINLYEPSSIDFSIAGKQAGLTLESRLPFNSRAEAAPNASAPTVSVKVKTGSPVKMDLRFRIPSWATGSVALNVNGKQVATGAPGTYVPISREWANGDVVSFSLPVGFRVTEYKGADKIAGHKRYAVEYGPILLAVTNRQQKEPPHINQDPAKIQEWLKPEPADASNPLGTLRFEVKDSPFVFEAYWRVPDIRYFTTFPVIEKH